MGTVVTEAFTWLKQDGAPAWLALFIVMIVLVAHSWMVKADPAGIIRSLLSIKKRRLEGMLTQEFLSPETRTLVERELRQRSLYKLTGIFEHRLQDTAVLFNTRFNVRADYLSKWRSWLSEHNGKICFSRKWYRISYWLFWAGAAIDTALWGGIAFLIGWELGVDRLWPALVICAIPWFLWLLFTMVPTRAMTCEMEAALTKFNEEQASLHERKSG